MQTEQKPKQEMIEDLTKQLCSNFVIDVNEVERFFEVDMPMIDCELEAYGEPSNTEYTYKVVLLRKRKDQTWSDFTKERAKRNNQTEVKQ